MTITIPQDNYQPLTDERGDLVTGAMRTDDGGLITRVGGVTLGQPVIDEDANTASWDHPFDPEAAQMAASRVAGAVLTPDPAEAPEL